MRHVCLITVATFLVLFQRGAGQQPGERVRVTVGSAAPFHQLIGTFVGRDRDSLWVELPERSVPVAVARTATARLEVSRGRHGAIIHGAEVGAGLGAISGFVISGVEASQSSPCRSALLVDVCFADWYGRAFRSGLIGAAAGGAIGAALGALWRTERWVGVPLSQVRLVALAPRHTSLAVSLAF